MDDFFTKDRCDRCNSKLKSRTLSMLNMDVICPACKKEERKHPKYKEACQKELEAIKNKDYNFKGVI